MELKTILERLEAIESDARNALIPWTATVQALADLRRDLEAHLIRTTGTL